MSKSWIPPDLQLCQGAVFRMWHEYREEGEKKRFFIVLNSNPRTDRLILLTTTTTQIQKLERHYGDSAERVLVYIHPSDYHEVDRFCVVDCQALEPWEKQSLTKKMNEKNCEFKTPLPEVLLKKILRNIANDKTIPSSLKSLIFEQSS